MGPTKKRPRPTGANNSGSTGFCSSGCAGGGEGGAAYLAASFLFQAWILVMIGLGACLFGGTYLIQLSGAGSTYSLIDVVNIVASVLLIPILLSIVL
jgi:hypothetical protein